MARSLFAGKWQNERQFLEYFENEWLRKNPNWFEGAMQRGCASNNSSLEATNRMIKDRFSFRNRLSVEEFAGGRARVDGR